jgi:hypothetical protein
MVRSKNRKFETALFLILLVLFIALLIGYVIAGFNSRYLADDYCNDVEFMQQGFWNGQVHSYLNPMPYSNERYSLTLKSGVDWILGGVKFMPFLPFLSILLWVFALFYTIRQGTKYLSYELSVLKIAFISTCIIFFTLYLAPNRYQILFWRSGMNTYLIPLLINTFILGRYFHYLKRDGFRIFGYLELGFLAFLAAGFSETVLALQAGFWGIILIFMSWRRQTTGVKAAGAILFGSLLGAILMIVNPTNALRQSRFPSPPSIGTVALTSLMYSLDFLRFTLRGAWLPFLILFFTGFLFGWLDLKSNSHKWRSAFGILAAFVIISEILLVCIMAPTIWSMSAYPENRGLLTGVYVLTLFIFIFGVWSGVAAKKILGETFSLKIHIAIGIVFTVLIGGYLIRAIQPTYDLIGIYQKRANLWDARNAEIIHKRSEGQTSIVVPGINSIGGILELQPETGYVWVNNCAAAYYLIESITTTE